MQAYQTVQKTTLSGKEIEVSVLTKGALLLQQCQNNWDDDSRDARLAEAVKYNQTIWSVFQSELAKPDNPLPKKLRQDILSLSLFIDKRLFEIMTSPALEKLNVVININLNLAAGLRSNAG
jgi:flagellar protein FlaF